MNLAIQSSIDGMMRQANRLACSMEGIVEKTQAAAEAREALLSIQPAGEALICLYGDLYKAQKSLESNGFSQEWFDMINKDNKFLDAINVDLMNLVGTDADKAEVCMEGLLGAIWDVVKRIWKWIIDSVGKLCGWLKRILLVYRYKGTNSEKLRRIIRALMGKEDLPEILQAVGTALNAESGRGGKCPDLRLLIERASVFRVIAAFFNNGITEILGLSTVNKQNVTDRQLVSAKLLELAQSGKDPENPIMALFKDYLSRDQSQINAFANMTTSGFKDGFTVMKDPSGFRDMMKRMGIGLTDARGASSFMIQPMQDVVTDIDYTEVFKEAEQYDGVFGVGLEREEGLCNIISQQAESTNTYLKYISDCIGVVLDDLKVYAMSGGKATVNHLELPVEPATGRALQLQARFVSETLSVLTKATSEMINTLGICMKLRDIYVKTCEKYLK